MSNAWPSWNASKFAQSSKFFMFYLSLHVCKDLCCDALYNLQLKCERQKNLLFFLFFVAVGIA